MDSLKKTIRNDISCLRAALTEDQIKEGSFRVFSKIEGNEVFINAQIVMVYWSIKDELATHDFIARWATSKTIVLPCIENDSLLARVFTTEENMIRHPRYGIPEPIGAIIPKETIDMVIVPGLAFDAKNNRLGYGKGFYDRFLKDMNAYKAGVGFTFQRLHNLPVDEYDISLDCVVTDE